MARTPKALKWTDTTSLFGGMWTVTLASGEVHKLNCNGGRGVGYRAYQCFGLNAKDAAFTRLKA